MELGLDPLLAVESLLMTVSTVYSFLFTIKGDLGNLGHEKPSAPTSKSSSMHAIDDVFNQ